MPLPSIPSLRFNHPSCTRRVCQSQPDPKWRPRGHPCHCCHRIYTSIHRALPADSAITVTAPVHRAPDQPGYATRTATSPILHSGTGSTWPSQTSDHLSTGLSHTLTWWTTCTHLETPPFPPALSFGKPFAHP